MQMLPVLVAGFINEKCSAGVTCHVTAEPVNGAAATVVAKSFIHSKLNAGITAAVVVNAANLCVKVTVCFSRRTPRFVALCSSVSRSVRKQSRLIVPP